VDYTCGGHGLRLVPTLVVALVTWVRGSVWVPPSNDTELEAAGEPRSSIRPGGRDVIADAAIACNLFTRRWPRERGCSGMHYIQIGVGSEELSNINSDVEERDNFARDPNALPVLVQLR
jgi:hypothetical protein